MSASPSTIEAVSCPLTRYLSLGATLYMPANRADLLDVLNHERLPQLRSLVVCTEDALAERDLESTLEWLKALLPFLQPVALQRFLRPRNPSVLGKLLQLEGIERFDGLVLPKIDEHNLPRYAELAARQPHWWLMLTIETEVAFNRRRLERLCRKLQQLENPVLCLRIGGNDLLQLLGLKRPPHLTAYDTPLAALIRDLLLVFRPAGYQLSAPVFDYLDSTPILAREVELDLAHGLWSKTAIHPSQIGTIEGAYRVSAEEYSLANSILAQDAPAVFRTHQQMVEPATHQVWARRILQRATVYGTESSPSSTYQGLSDERGLLSYGHHVEQNR